MKIIRPALLLLCLGATLRAMTITGYSPEVNDLYSSGFSTATPVRNADASFVGAGYDWTGIGWVSDSPSGRVTHVTMITPLHTLSARHASVSLLGTQVRLVNNDGDVLDVALQGTSTLAATTPAGDLNIAALERAVTASEGIAPLRLLDIAGGNYINQPLLMLGSNGGVSRVATSAVWTQGTNTAGASFNLLNSAHSFQAWESGDSGSPALIVYDGRLMVAGTAWYPYSFASLFETSTYTPATAINDLLADTGYALKWSIYDNPSDSANTANVWSGGAGTGALNTAGNWLNPAAPVADQPVVFDADAANGQTALALDAGLSLRGILFRASESSSAFSFGGAHTLVIGQTGIRNESAATQTFNLPIALSGAQNWEAVNGDLAFNGPIDNAGHLLAIGGAADTTITGVISGSGGLAKDDSGTLTLAAANTYAGTTFLHDGTLRLAPGGGLGAGAVAFIAGNTATLDLNGQNQTVAGLTSDYGGTGRVLLGGATLTVNNAATGRYDGSIEGAGSLVKTGAGLWILSGENTHTGPTRLEGGVLRLSSTDALSANSNLAFNGGILELGAGDFTRSLGTGAGQVQFTGVGVGGFSAHGGTRVVNLGGEGAEVAWGVGGFVPDATGFRLSATTSDSTLEFQNAINLGGAYRNIVVNNGSAAIDARITGVIRNGSLVKHGSGVLELTALNTYAGHTQINDGALLISTEGALGAGNLVFVGSGGGVLALGSGDFTRELGNGDNLVRFVTGGGFAAVGADRVVNLGGAGATVTWGQGDFVPNGNLLVLSSGSISDAMVDFQNAIDLNGGDRTFQIGDGTARIDSRLSGVLGNGGIIKTGGGTLELTAANTYAGQTFVNGGVLLASHASALGNGNLRLASGGVFMMGAGDFTRALGTGADQVQFTGSGGFAARGVDRVVNLGGAGATVTWGSAGFVPLGSALYLGANSADATVDFVNPVDLAGASRTIWVNDGSAAIDARLRGGLSNGGLTKGGAGVLELAVANTYAGQTRVNGGVLLLAHADALPDASALAFSESGVLGLATGDFTRSLGTGAGQLQFIGSGGFAAYGADRAVNLGGAGATVTWGIANTGINGRLVLSSASADGTLNWQNSINLGTSALGTRIIEVHDGSAEVDARMNGVIYTGGVGWGVEKAGAGTLEFAAGTSYTGATLVSAGRLIVGAGGTMTATSGITVKTGAIFDYRSSVAALGRAVTVDGGAFLYNSTSAYTGALTFTSGLIGGSGNLGSTALTIGAGRTIAPGNGNGADTLRTGSQTWGNGGVYQWEIVSLDGAAGQADGWDLLQIQGDLNILADAGGFTIRLESTDSLTGWDKGSDYIWTIATVVGSALGGDPLLATIDAAGFSTHNDLGGGWFGLQLDGSDLNLVFTAAIPETCTSLIPFLAFLATAFRRGGRRPSRASVASVRPQARSLGRSAPARGFALLVTITLVAFLVLILVSLATFTRVETQVAANSQQSEQARQHALMSLGIAVGQLQKFAGPDQRVTAVALGDGTNGLVAPRDGTRFWTGVWGNRNAPGDDLARPVLLNWLVGGNEDVTFTATETGEQFGRITQPASDATPPFAPDAELVLTAAATALDELTLGGSPARLLVGPRTAGGMVENYVVAPLGRIQMPAGNLPGLTGTSPVTVGHHAWWIGDEGVKARVNLADHWNAHGDAASRPWSFANAQRAAGELLFTGLPTDDSVTRLLAPGQIPMADATLTESALGARIHDITVHSRSVIADVRKGGLKRDLTRILEPGGGSAAEADNRFLFPDETNSTGPSAAPFYTKPPAWGLLRDFARFTGVANDPLPLQTPTAIRQGIHPVLMYAGMAYTWSANNPGTSSDQDISVYVSPLAVLWNPYNRRLAGGDFEIGFEAPRKGPAQGIVTLVLRNPNPAYNPVDPASSEDIERELHFNLTAAAFETATDAGGNRIPLDTPASTARVFLRFRASVPVLEPGAAVYLRLPTGASGDYQPGVSALEPLPYLRRLDYSDAARLRLDHLTVPKAETCEVNIPMRNLGETNIYLAKPGTGGNPAVALDATSDDYYQWIGRVGADSKYGTPGGDLLTLPEVNVQSGTGLTPGPRPLLAVETLHQLGMFLDAYSPPPLPVRWIAQANPRAYMVLRTSLEDHGNPDDISINPVYFSYVSHYARIVTDYTVTVGDRYINLRQFPTSEATVGNSYNNGGYDADGFRPYPQLFELPHAGEPLFSIANLQHAAVSAHATSPAHAIGNSLANFRVKDFGDTVRGSVADVSSYGPRASAIHDLSFRLNQILWDRYFFSTLANSGATGDPLPPILPNPRHVYAENSAGLTLADLADTEGRRAAAHLFISGGFNVNSTSVEAWKAVLGGLHNLAYDPQNPSATNPTPLSHPFSRFRHPNAGSERVAPQVLNTRQYWGGYRQLTEDELAGLAWRVVEEVRARGPFLSLADFVNRGLDTTRHTGSAVRRLLKGALQAAIDDEGPLGQETAHRQKDTRINFALSNSTSVEGGGVHALQLLVHPTPFGLGLFGHSHRGAINTADYNLRALSGWNTENYRLSNNPFTLHGSGNASSLTQADILSTVGASLSARSDTFLVRTYGESINPVTGDVEARAWCEAVVQRMPDYVNPHADAAWEEPRDLTDADNRRFGRRFEVVSFRWLSPEDI